MPIIWNIIFLLFPSSCFSCVQLHFQSSLFFLPGKLLQYFLQWILFSFCKSLFCLHFCKIFSLDTELGLLIFSSSTLKTSLDFRGFINFWCEKLAKGYFFPMYVFFSLLLPSCIFLFCLQGFDHITQVVCFSDFHFPYVSCICSCWFSNLKQFSAHVFPLFVFLSFQSHGFQIVLQLLHVLLGWSGLFVLWVSVGLIYCSICVLLIFFILMWPVCW